MPTQRPQGRMIRVDIADDAGLAKLSDGAARLYFYLTPHLTAHGKFAGGAPTMRDNVVPLLGWSEKRILGYLAEINAHTSMKAWKQLGRVFVHDITFSDKQSLKDDRKGRDSVPSYPGQSRLKTSGSPYSLPELVKSYSGVTPPEVEVEVEFKEKEKEEVELELQRQGSTSASDPLVGQSAVPTDNGNGTAKASSMEGPAGKPTQSFKDTALEYAQGKFRAGEWGLKEATENLQIYGFNTTEIRGLMEQTLSD